MFRKGIQSERIRAIPESVPESQTNQKNVLNVV